MPTTPNKKHQETKVNRRSTTDTKGAKANARSAGTKRKSSLSEPIIFIPLSIIILFIVFVILVRNLGFSVAPPAKAVDSIACSLSPKPATSTLHISIFINGHSETIPQGIGFQRPWASNTGTEGSYSGSIITGGTCEYPLTTVAPTGLVHILGPTSHNYTLGLFFDLWHEAFLNSTDGNWTASTVTYLNGHVYSGNIRNLPLANHDVIQIDVGSLQPAARSYSFS